MYGPGTGFAKKNMCWKCILGILWGYLWITSFMKTLSPTNHVFRAFIPTGLVVNGRVYPGIEHWDASGWHCSGDLQLPEGSHHTSEPTQVHPWRALGEGLWLERGCLEGRWGEESGWESTAPRHPWGNYIIYLFCITGFPMAGLFLKKFCGVTRVNFGICWAGWFSKLSNLNPLLNHFSVASMYSAFCFS